MLLLSALTALTVVAFTDPDGSARFAWRTGTWALLVAAVWGFLTMCAGAFVSSSGAGLACPSFPGCGPAFFGSGGPQAAQMGHRFLALIFAIFAVSAAFLVPAAARRATIAVRIGLCLLGLQIGLGIANVLAGMPAPLREAHAANAGLTFLSFVVAALLASLDESPVSADSQASAAARPMPAPP
jgi:heme A synthase